MVIYPLPIFSLCLCLFSFPSDFLFNFFSDCPENAASSLVSCSSSGTDSDSSEGQVILQKIWDLVPFSSFKINNLLDDHYKPRERHIIVKEAREMVGWELTYNLTSFNCEHFVTLLRYGKPESQQVGLLWLLHRLI